MKDDKSQQTYKLKIRKKKKRVTADVRRCQKPSSRALSGWLRDVRQRCSLLQKFYNSSTPDALRRRNNYVNSVYHSIALFRKRDWRLIFRESFFSSLSLPWLLCSFPWTFSWNSLRSSRSVNLAITSLIETLYLNQKSVCLA